jgi:hypothetical protein
MCSLRVVAVLVSASFLSWGCATYTGPEPAGPDLGELSFYLETGDDGVTGFCFEVAVEVEGEKEVIADSCEDLKDMYFPSRLLPDAGDMHRFADAYFVLEPGTYWARAIPMAGDEASEICHPSEWTMATVEAERTTEIFLISQCECPDNGGLDIVVVLNHCPIIVELTFDPNKFIGVCDQLMVEVVAEDPDGDPITYSFELLTEEVDCADNIFTDGNMLYFSTCDCELEPTSNGTRCCNWPWRFCGDGWCSAECGETCSTCAEDCGLCPPVCGDGLCNGDESCGDCPDDCGPCPPPPCECGCGDYQFRVTACDPWGGCTTLEFPVHVACP